MAVLVTDGFEQVELVEPRHALDQAGASTSIVAPKGILDIVAPGSSVAPKSGYVRGWKFVEWGEEFRIDVALDQTRPEDFDALLLPGGMINPDILRTQPKAVAFVRAFFDSDKPVATTCHGPLTIIEAGAARGRRIASWPSIKTDVKNAGAEWVDRDVVVDGNLVSSRKPDDLPAFNRELLKLLSRADGREARTA